MPIDKSFIIDVAEEALDMKSSGKEDWCISWLEWFWQQEIEMAICSIKQGES
jgi:hypothetical protein